MMTVADLLEMLEGLDEDLEVRVLTQPSYPLQSALAGVVDFSLVDDEEELESWQNDHADCEGVDFAANVCRNHQSDDLARRLTQAREKAETVVYLVEGSQMRPNPYGPRAAFDRV